MLEGILARDTRPRASSDERECDRGPLGKA